MPSLHQGQKRSNNLSEIEEGLDMISSGIEILEQTKLPLVTSKAGIDLTAKLNAQLRALVALHDPRKEEIKVKYYENEPSTYVRGNLFKACIRRYPKSFPNFDTIKRFLGAAKWAASQETKVVQEVSFDIQQ